MLHIQNPNTIGAPRKNGSSVEAKRIDILISADHYNQSLLTGYDGWSFYILKGIIFWLQRLFHLVQKWHLTWNGDVFTQSEGTFLNFSGFIAATMYGDAARYFWLRHIKNGCCEQSDRREDQCQYKQLFRRQYHWRCGAGVKCGAFKRRDPLRRPLQIYYWPICPPD